MKEHSENRTSSSVIIKVSHIEEGSLFDPQSELSQPICGLIPSTNGVVTMDASTHEWAASESTISIERYRIDFR